MLNFQRHGRPLSLTAPNFKAEVHAIDNNRRPHACHFIPINYTLWLGWINGGVNFIGAALAGACRRNRLQRTD